MRSRSLIAAALLAWLPVEAGSVPAAPLAEGEARARRERPCQIRKDKLDPVLPEAMRGNGIGVWVVDPVNPGLRLIR